MKMREIKFRALYDHMGGGWKYGMLIYEGDVPRIQVDGTMTFPTCLKGTEGQFTGLQDKNGKDIYEGDQCFAKFKTKLGIVIVGGEIIMDEYMWCLKDTMGNTDELYSINRLHDIDIIGNIHEGINLKDSSQV